MYGCFDLIAKPKKVFEAFKLHTELEFQPSYNIAPSQDILVIVHTEDSEQPLTLWFQWSFIPSWAKDANIGHSLINARAETVAIKPSFRSTLKHRPALLRLTDLTNVGNKRTANSRIESITITKFLPLPACGNVRIIPTNRSIRAA